MLKPAEANGISSVQSLKVNIRGCRTCFPSAATAASSQNSSGEVLVAEMTLKGYPRPNRRT